MGNILAIEGSTYGILKIEKKSILDMDVDVIVCPKSIKFENGLIGNIIDRKAGRAFTDEIEMIKKNRNGKSLSVGEILHAGPGQSSYKAIIIAPSLSKDSRPIPEQMKDVKTTLKAVLLYAEQQLKVSSIAIPAISGGSAGFEKTDIAKAIIEGLGEFMLANDSGTLTEIHLVDTNDDMVEQWELHAKGCNLLSLMSKRGYSKTKDTLQINLPKHWRDMGTQSFMKYELHPLSSEYKRVALIFTDQTDSKWTIDKVTKIQNSKLYRPFHCNHIEMNDRSPAPKEIMRELWHGTCFDVTDEISKNGFNRSCANVTALYGKGTYFACCASYSAQDSYAQQDSHGFRYMFLAAVLVGDYIKGNSEMKVPPSRDLPDQTIRYDSTVDCPEEPTIFVSYHDNQMYPKYLLKFH